MIGVNLWVTALVALAVVLITFAIGSAKHMHRDASSVQRSCA